MERGDWFRQPRLWDWMYGNHISRSWDQTVAIAAHMKMLARASWAKCERIGGRELSAKELEQRLKNGQALFARMEHQISPSTAPIYESPCTAFLPKYSQLEPALPIYLSANYDPVVATPLLVF